MSDLLSMQVLLWMGEAFAASSLIVALAWLAAARKTASQRHLVWLAGFVALAALPVLAIVVPSQFTYRLPGPVIPVTQGFDPAIVAATAPAPEPAHFTLDMTTVITALIALWLLGVMLIALRGLLAAFALYNLRRNSVPHRFGHLAIDGPRCELRLSQDDCGPMTWGVFHPVVLLPAEAEEWPRARLEAVLLHELAHVRRKDSLTQLISLAISALYWPNPLVWLAAARLRREAETAADDAVIAAGVRPSVYAGELLQIASEFRVQRLSLPLAMAAPSALEARVKSVLAENNSRSGVTRMDVFKIACLGLMATSAIVLARPSLAQDAPQVQTAPLPPAAPSASSADDAAPPPAPAPAAAPQAETRPDSVVIDTDENGHHHIHHFRDLSPAERARIQSQVRDAMAKARPQIERAMREVERTRPRVEEAMRQVEIVRPRIEEAMRQVEATRPQIEAAMAEAMRSTHQIDEEQIQAALAKARVELAKLPSEVQLKVEMDRAMARAQDKMAQIRLKMRGHAMIVEDDSDGPAVDDMPPVPPAPPAPDVAPPPPPAVAPPAPVPPAPPQN